MTETENNTGAAIAVPNTSSEVPFWKHEGRTFPAFVVNGRDSVGIQIKRNKSDINPIGILVGFFAWEKSDTFRNRLDLDWKRVTDVKERISESHARNFDLQNAECFDEIITGGKWIPFTDGAEGEAVELSREQMLSRTTEIKSEMISQWLTAFHIERYFNDDIDEFDALTGGNVEEITFLCKIGDPLEPSNLLLIGFTPPSDEERRVFDDNKIKNKSKAEGGMETVTSIVDNARKIRYAKKYLHSVKGAVVVGETGEFNAVESNDANLTEFKKFFNGDWLIRLADALQDSFDTGGK